MTVRIRSRCSGPPSSRRAVAFGLAAALAAGVLTATETPADAAGPMARADGTLSSPDAQLSDTRRSLDRAAASGSPVEIATQRTENSKTYANPDGTFTMDRYVRPVHVRQNGAFVPGDDTLVAGKDGTVRPKAARADFAFSGGGSKAPLAVVRKDGRELALTWPGKLPKPALDGDTATYPEVLPGVDLKIISEVDSFSHVLVVKTPEAGRNPALARLEFGLAATGVKVGSTPDGSMTAVDPAGETVFSSPPAKMWDSKGSAAGTQARAAAAPTDADPADGAADTAKQADVKVEIRPGTMTLTADPALLHAVDTVYPVVIDPTVRTDWKDLWAIAYKNDGVAGSENTPYINGGSLSKEARVGCALDPGYGNAKVCAKTFFHVSTRALLGKQVIDATLRIKQNYAGSHSCQSGEIEVWSTGRIESTTTWAHQPPWNTKIDASGKSFGGRNCPTGDDLVEFNVTTAVRAETAKGSDTWAFGLKSQADTVDVSWRRLDAASARVSVTYNTPPATPYDRSTDPSVPCAGGSFGLTDYVTLRSRLWDDEDNSVSAQFAYWKEGGAVAEQWTAVVRGNVASVRIPTTSLDNGTYVWDVRAYDNRDYGAWAGQCRFTIDKTRPSRPPTVSSTEFPDGDGGTWGAPARTPGTFTLGASGVTDVVRYEWYTDFDTAPRSVPAQGAGGPASFTFTPLVTGPHFLYVTSFDAAGNRSDVRNYLFYAARSASRDKPGDINGDETTDLWTVDRDGGQLRMHPGDGTGGFGLSKDADNSGYLKASITHRGDWGEDGYEDLIVLRPGADGLPAIFRRDNAGDGTLRHRDLGEAEFRVYAGANKHWAQGGQVVSLGSVNDDAGPGGLGPDGVVDDNDWADLLLLSDGKLWLYYGSKEAYLDSMLDPVSIGDAAWGDKTVMTPGDTTGDGLPELWVRENGSGLVYEYRSRTDANGNFDPSAYADPAARVQIGSGFTAAAYPQLTSAGDLENKAPGTRYPDLWGTDPDGRVVEFPGRALSGGSAFGSARTLVVNSRSWSDCQTFSSSDAGTHTLCGPLLTKYLSLGGPAGRLRYPTTDVVAAADGAGRFAHFQGQGTTGTAANGSIHWSPTTGAWYTHGGTRAKWLSTGGESGHLGYPNADEQVVPGSGGEGFISTFAGGLGKTPGAVLYSGATGSHELHGASYDRFVALGGPRVLGYPSADESVTAPKSGTYVHFRPLGAASDTSSLYWSAATGSHLVKNAIRGSWAGQGWENSALGWPTSDEFAVPGGARSNFENGFILWDAVTGTVTSSPYAPLPATRPDMNGDNHADLLVLGTGGGIEKRLNYGDGAGFGGGVAISQGWQNYLGNTGQGKLYFADVDGDNRKDLLVLGTDGTIQRRLNYGDGAGFGGGVVISQGWQNFLGEAGQGRLYFADINGDSRADLLVMGQDGSIERRLNYGNGAGFGGGVLISQGWQNYLGNTGQGKLYFADVDGDNRADLLALGTAGGIEVRPNYGDGAGFGGGTTVSEGWQNFLGDAGQGKLYFADVDGDNRADLLVLGTGGAVEKRLNYGNGAGFGGGVAISQGWQNYLGNPGQGRLYFV
ncbi:FG-GAP-like repeat-containing protein [Uniformispora flossi]|uniref:FG-GAP-like repeat-containing protein n=1 Tax=Uniformispora flossi TaxID=3390723 RepID=UPI003C2CE77B